MADHGGFRADLAQIEEKPLDELRSLRRNARLPSELLSRGLGFCRVASASQIRSLRP